jgi:hypothetical protein
MVLVSLHTLPSALVLPMSCAHLGPSWRKDACASAQGYVGVRRVVSVPMAAHVRLLTPNHLPVERAVSWLTMESADASPPQVSDNIHQLNYAIIPSAVLLSFCSWMFLPQWILSGLLLPCWDCRGLLLQSSPREVLQKLQRRLYTMVRVSGFQYALVIFAITTQPCGTWKVLQLNQACKWMNNVACYFLIH